MSEATIASPAPKTPMSTKKLLLIAVSILTILGIGNHFTIQLGYATVDVTLSDSAVSVVAVPVELPVTDTLKLDTLK